MGNNPSAQQNNVIYYAEPPRQELMEKDTLHKYLKTTVSISKIEDLIWRHLGTGYDINQLNDDHKTPLMIAIENDSLSSVLYIRLLMTHKPNVNVVGKRQIFSGHSCRTVQTTALHLALYHMREYEVIKMLLDASADIYWIDEERRNALLVGASINVCADILEMILEHPQDIDRIDIYGKSALHLICGSASGDINTECEKCIKLLIKHGADVFLKDAHGKTPMDIALKNANLKAAAELMKAGVSI